MEVESCVAYGRWNIGTVITHIKRQDVAPLARGGARTSGPRPPEIYFFFKKLYIIFLFIYFFNNQLTT